jgi:hypothetical protein
MLSCYGVSKHDSEDRMIGYSQVLLCAANVLHTQAVTLHKRKAQSDVIRLLRASGVAAG